MIPYLLLTHMSGKGISRGKPCLSSHEFRAPQFWGFSCIYAQWYRQDYMPARGTVKKTENLYSRVCVIGCPVCQSNTIIKQETLLSTTNRATNLCKCNGVADLPKTRPSPIPYVWPLRKLAIQLYMYNMYILQVATQLVSTYSEKNSLKRNGGT